MKTLIEEMTGKDYREGDFEVALVPVGSTENHGDHLPFGQDTHVAYRLSKLIAERAGRTLVIPPLFYGMSEHYQHLPFSISLRPENLIRVLDDVFASIYRWGIKRIVVINGHDGNIAPLEVSAREFKVVHPDVLIAVLDKWWELPGRLLPQGTFEVWDGLGHAGEGETSISLYLFPEMVDMSQARGVIPGLPLHVDVKWLFCELTPTGATGDPTRATKEKGRMMTEVVVDVVVRFIEDMRKAGWKYGLSQEARESIRAYESIRA